MPILQSSPFLERLIAFLLPYFTGMTADIAAARAEALETLASYGARTRAELLCSAQIIVFSFAALETLAEATNPQLSPSMRLRYRGCANNLNRSSQKTEQTLAKRLTCDVPEATDTQTEAVIDIPDADAEQIMQDTQAAVQAFCDRATANRPTTDRSAHSQQHTSQSAKPQSKEAQNKRLWGAAMMDTLVEMGMPVQPASGTTPASGG